MKVYFGAETPNDCIHRLIMDGWAEVDRRFNDLQGRFPQVLLSLVRKARGQVVK
jgi:hypothetical protein